MTQKVAEIQIVDYFQSKRSPGVLKHSSIAVQLFENFRKWIKCNKASAGKTDCERLIQAERASTLSSTIVLIPAPYLQELVHASLPLQSPDTCPENTHTERTQLGVFSPANKRRRQEI